MKTIMGNLTGALLVAAAALGTGRPQSTTHELRLSDIRAQQPNDRIFASALCQRARESRDGWIIQQYSVDPKTFVQDLNTLMEKSDEVILAGMLDDATVLSPTGESTATYYDARVVRSWKGPHHAGDTVTYGLRGGSLPCEPSTPGTFTRRFDVVPVDHGYTIPEPYVFVLFLRQSEGNETKLVQGLRPAAGEGWQGLFAISVPGPTYGSGPETDCVGGHHWSWQRCDAYLETSQSPVAVPNARDPLAKKYGGMPASEFLREVQSVAAAQAVEEKSPSK